MSERTYYVLGSDNCRFESMTKEQIYDAIAEATGSTPTPVDGAFITKIKEMNANGEMKWWVGTEAQYNAIATKDARTLYIITDSSDYDDLIDRITPIDKGGTGATTAEDARENLGLGVVIWEGTSVDGHFTMTQNQIDMCMSYSVIRVIYNESEEVVLTCETKANKRFSKGYLVGDTACGYGLDVYNPLSRDSIFYNNYQGELQHPNAKKIIGVI